ncbi:MAG TPA: LuxR C-terminal-related transcriptional regulator [Polyangiaceae bacterium]|nr:LuxR C-terminal-related transcriptional regulator [Polyangiaceae bacterium]
MRAQHEVLIEAANSARCVADYETALFAELNRSIGFEVAFCLRSGSLGPVTPGFQSSVRAETRGRWQGYREDFRLVEAHARRVGRVVVDREVLGARQLERTSVYREVMQPHHGESSLIAYLGAGSQIVTGVVLGRTRTRFKRTEVERLSMALPVLTVCELAVGRRMPVESELLSAREREILSYLRLGYTNREIGIALGTSFRTVRNQLSQLFEKLGVSTRAEAVGRSAWLDLG